MLSRDWTAIWYQCLVCKRLFQYKDLLQNHKNNTPCGKLYKKLKIKNLNTRPKILSGSNTSQIKIESSKNSKFEAKNKPSVSVNQLDIPKLGCTSDKEEPQDQSKSTATDIKTANIDNHQKSNGNSKVGVSFDMTKHYQCRFCYLQFETMRHLKMHTSLHINKGQKNQCYFCRAKFKLYDNLAIHMRIHTGELPNVCKCCDARCANLNQHKCKILLCHYCKGISFKKVKDLQQHMLNEHGHIQFPVINEISNHLQCKTEITGRFQDNAQSNRPVLAIYIPPTKEIDKNFFCKVCKRSFSNFGNFKQHIGGKLHRLEFLRSNIIKIKNKLKKSKSLYKKESSRSKIQNLKVVLSGKSKNWTCYVCGHAFKLKASLFAHFAVHTGKYRCEFCNRNFRDSYDMRKHFKTKTHKRNSNKKKGDWQFKSDSSRLNTHQDSKPSPEKFSIQTQNELEFSCEYCDKSFNTKFGLNEHLSYHKQGGVEMKYCTVCNIQFKKYRLFKNHLGGQTHLKNQQIIDDLLKKN